MVGLGAIGRPADWSWAEVRANGERQKISVCMYKMRTPLNVRILQPEDLLKVP